MVESYKYKSKIATAISCIAALIVYIGKDELTKIMPTEYAYLTPIIVIIAGYILAQSTENKRVDIAEQMILDRYKDKESVCEAENDINDDGGEDDI